MTSIQSSASFGAYNVGEITRRGEPHASERLPSSRRVLLSTGKGDRRSAGIRVPRLFPSADRARDSSGGDHQPASLRSCSAPHFHLYLQGRLRVFGKETPPSPGVKRPCRRRGADRPPRRPQTLRADAVGVGHRRGQRPQASSARPYPENGVGRRFAETSCRPNRMFRRLIL